MSRRADRTIDLRFITVCLSALLVFAPICISRANDAGIAFDNRLAFDVGPRPVASGFNSKLAEGPLRLSNANLAQHIVDLAFRLEVGPARLHLPKWKLPLSISLSWPQGIAFRDEFAFFLRKLKRLTGIAFTIAREHQAQIHIRVAPAIEMRRMLGSSFCIAVPDHYSWHEYATHFRSNSQTDWSREINLRKATIFIPDTARPYLVRACLREELMQSLGPAGDFYYLAGSIYNDDQIHMQPSAFDFLVLRVLYDDRIRAGMAMPEVKRQAKIILDEIHPAGRNVTSVEQPTSDKAWEKSFQLAQLMHHPKFADGYYIDAIARTAAMVPQDPRRLLTRLESARNLQRYSPQEAYGKLLDVAKEYRALLGPDQVYEATARLDAARAELWLKKFDRARATAVATLRTFIDHGLESKIVEALLIRDAADDKRQRPTHLADARADTRAWAFYALGREKPFNKTEMPASGTRPSLTGVLVAAALIVIIAIVLLRLRARSRQLR